MIKFRDDTGDYYNKTVELYKNFSNTSLLIGTPFKHTQSGEEICNLLMPKMHGDISDIKIEFNSTTQSMERFEDKKKKENFAEHIKNESDDKLIDLALMVCMDLKILHDKGWVHGDIHPSNILFSLTDTGIGEVRLSDFDTTCHVESDKVYNASGRISAFVPEVMEDKVAPGPKGGQRIDVHCLATSLEVLFSQIRQSEKMSCITNLVNKMKAENPEERPSIGDIIQILNEIKSSSTITTKI